jgi:membrane carboxypeptidase/penicillin-binding protein
MWTTFMKAATKSDQPAWIDQPAGVTTANVCRLSGKLAAEGCAHVEVVDEEGQLQQRSMIYTEYFARGTVPTAYCDLHPTHGFFGSIAAIFKGTDKPAPMPLQATGLVPAPVAASTSGAVAAATPPKPEKPPEPPKKKKRGFWSRLFGGGGDKDKDKDKN